MELETHAVIDRELGYLGPEELAAIQSNVEEIGKMLNGLIHALKSRGNLLKPNP